MMIGVLADIHEHVENLAAALRLFERKQVDRVVVLGDICDTGGRLRETTLPLIEAGAVGVWGNHELGFCVEPDPDLTAKYDDAVIEYLQTLKPALEVDGVLFTHGMPDWDATDPTPYYLGDGPFVAEALSNVFSMSRNWLFLMGHFHRWFAADVNGPIDWDGQEEIEVVDRCAAVVGPVFRGSCAVLDTNNRTLSPYCVS